MPIHFGVASPLFAAFAAGLRRAAELRVSTRLSSNPRAPDEAPPRATRRRRIIRVLRWVSSGLACVTLLYLIGMNIFLRTRLFRDAISFDPGSFRVEYANAHSVLPGRIHVEGLTIRGRDSSVEWIMTLDRCDFRVSFLDLVRRRFHARRVRGEGLSLRARRRLDEVNPSVAALPPVLGFRDPPRKDVGPPEPPLTDENYRLWGVELDDVVAEHVREIWVDTVRCAGDFTVRGRWFFRPLRSLEVGPAVVDLRSAEVSFGQLETWASDLRGSIGVTLHPPDLRESTGTDFIDHASVDADAGAILRADLVMNRLLASGEGDETVITHAVAPVHVRLRLERGLIRPGTHLVAEPFDAEVRRGTLSLRTRAEADVRVEDKDGQNVGIASVRASASRLFARSAEVACSLARPKWRRPNLSRPW
jgi:hypothetical protein